MPKDITDRAWKRSNSAGKSDSAGNRAASLVLHVDVHVHDSAPEVDNFSMF